MHRQMSCERIQKIFEKEEIRIDFLGASATEGEGLADSNTAYPVLWTDKMQNLFPSKRFKWRNLAQSGTFATHGLFAAEEYIKENHTELVFLEYALNDEITPFSVDVYESLVRKLSGYSAVVIPIILPIKDYPENGYYMVEIAKHYQLPYLDIGEKLRQEIEQENMHWENYAQDATHPSKQGHVWIAEEILTLFREILHFKGTKTVDWSLPEKCYFKNTYENLHVKIFDSAPSFPMELSIECSNFWVVYRKHYDDGCGTLQVSSDKGISVLLYGYSMFCWDYYFPEKIWQGDKKEVHNFFFKMLPQDAKKEFVIRAIGWC